MLLSRYQTPSLNIPILNVSYTVPAGVGVGIGVIVVVDDGEVIIAHILDGWLACALNSDLIISARGPGRINR